MFASDAMEPMEIEQSVQHQRQPWKIPHFCKICLCLLVGWLLIIMIFVLVHHSDADRSRPRNEDYRIENTTLIDFNLSDDTESLIAFHITYTVVGRTSFKNISVLVSLEGLKDFFLANSGILPSPILQPYGELTWFVDSHDTLKMNSTQFDSLTSQTRNGKVTFDIQIRESNGDTFTCPVEATLPEKVTKARECRI